MPLFWQALAAVASNLRHRHQIVSLLFYSRRMEDEIITINHYNFSPELSAATHARILEKAHAIHADPASSADDLAMAKQALAQLKDTTPIQWPPSLEEQEKILHFTQLVDACAARVGIEPPRKVILKDYGGPNAGVSAVLMQVDHNHFALGQLDDASVDVTLTHEMTHVKQRDGELADFYKPSQTKNFIQVALAYALAHDPEGLYAHAQEYGIAAQLPQLFALCATQAQSDLKAYQAVGLDNPSMSELYATRFTHQYAILDALEPLKDTSLDAYTVRALLGFALALPSNREYLATSGPMSDEEYEQQTQLGAMTFMSYAGGSAYLTTPYPNVSRAKFLKAMGAVSAHDLTADYRTFIQKNDFVSEFIADDGELRYGCNITAIDRNHEKAAQYEEAQRKAYNLPVVEDDPLSDHPSTPLRRHRSQRIHRLLRDQEFLTGHQDIEAAITWVNKEMFEGREMGTPSRNPSGHQK